MSDPIQGISKVRLLHTAQDGSHWLQYQPPGVLESLAAWGTGGSSGVERRGAGRRTRGLRPVTRRAIEAGPQRVIKTHQCFFK